MLTLLISMESWFFLGHKGNIFNIWFGLPVKPTLGTT